MKLNKKSVHVSAVVIYFFLSRPSQQRLLFKRIINTLTITKALSQKLRKRESFIIVNLTIINNAVAYCLPWLVIITCDNTLA